jgi:hypothetical protein
MRTLSLGLALTVAVVTAGCSFRIGGKPEPTTPQAQTTPPPGPAPAAAAPASTKPRIALGRAKVAPGATPANPGAEPAPSAAPVLAGTNVFGQGTPDVAGWKGSFFVLPAGTQKLPDLATQAPNGVLFAKELNVAQKAMTGGFPGIDPNRNENFAIRWQAPLVVDTESDYAFRLVSDDGANVLIDDTLIVDNDGVHTAQEKAGPVHLVKGTHILTVDYFQGTGPVALQLFCKKAGGTETVCPTHLQ